MAAGRPGALEELIPLVYESLRSMARSQLRRRGGIATIDTSGLVHEAYLKLVDHKKLDMNGRDHFLAVYSLAMRDVLVDLARRRSAKKRGGDRQRVTLDSTVIRIDDQAEVILAVNDALERLSALSPRLGRTVECRFFAGLTEAETARVLSVNERTVRRDWVKAKAVLFHWLHPD
jgi:RNA polymerase sigma factor (TIGR02999 family)